MEFLKIIALIFRLDTSSVISATVSMRLLRANQMIFGYFADLKAGSDTSVENTESICTISED
jgi:hypothetical protein